MAAELLDTRTVPLLDLLGNGKRFVVPPFQRDYSWKQEQWEDLWNDLQAAAAPDAPAHYMGALVLQRQTDREFVIIDGQQRIATLSILALAVIGQLQRMADDGIEPENNRERAIELRKRFISDKDPASLIESTKLTLNENDHGIYQDNLIRLRPPFHPRAIKGSAALLWQCFEYFAEKIAEVAVAGADGQALAALLAEVAARKLLFIQVTVQDDGSAFTVFETLNARGLELSNTDLIKNYLFSRLHSRDDQTVLQRRWNAMLGVVEPADFPAFLRYHLLTEEGGVRRPRLFKMIRDRVPTAQEVFPLIDTMERRATIFAALEDPFHELWTESAGARDLIAELALFRSSQTAPLIFAVVETLPADEWARVLRVLRTLVFRYTVVGQRNPNALEPAVHQAARAVLDGRASNAGSVFRVLRPIYVADEDFRSDMARLQLPTNGQRKRLAKYILARLEQDRRGVAMNADPATIEHILPENPDPTWRSAIPEERWAERIYMLGNLTLLEKSANRRIGNSGYPAKCQAYAESSYAITRDIAAAAPEEWTVSTIAARQVRLADRAVHLWREDF